MGVGSGRWEGLTAIAAIIIISAMPYRKNGKRVGTILANRPMTIKKRKQPQLASGCNRNMEQPATHPNSGWTRAWKDCLRHNSQRIPSK